MYWLGEGEAGMQLMMTSQRKLFKAFVEVVLVSGILFLHCIELVSFSLWAEERLKVSTQQLFLWFAEILRTSCSAGCLV